MTTFSAHLQKDERLHLWMRPPHDGGTGRMAVALDGAEHVLAVDGPTRNPLPLVWDSPATGDARFKWDRGTEVSLVYAFAPLRLSEVGIRVLWTSAAATLDGARYRLHFAPPFGWMNDPNGLCEIDGITHLFYQHNPHGRRWDTMHWGHAISRDGVNWLHQPIALLPREDVVRGKDTQGGAYSGSARAHYGTINLFYTDRHDGPASRRERQMTISLGDGWRPGASKILLDAYPPVPDYGQDWRDPFVFDGPDGRPRMLLGGADSRSSLVLLYETRDQDGTSGWEFVDVLFRETSRRNVPAECPCMIRLDGEDDVWVLIFGLIGSRDPVTRRRNLTRTHVGRFDGRHFQPLYEHELDFGADCYAMQVWRGGDGPRGMAWAANWTDVFADRDFETAMTLPRRLLWRQGRLLTPPISAVNNLRSGPPATIDGSAALPILDGLAEVELEVAPGATFILALEHPTHAVMLTYDSGVLELHYEPPGNRSTPSYRTAYANLQALRLFVDIGLIELYADGGQACCTKRIDSPFPFETVRLFVNAGVASGKVWSLRR